MRTLSPPCRESAREDLEANVYTYQYKQQTRGYDPTPDEIDAIIELYDNYDEANGQVTEGFDGEGLEKKLISTVRKAFAKTYEGKPLHGLREALLSGAGLCPICGIDFATQLDHFLPKADFGIFSIYSRNLVPVCKTCNEDKRTSAGENPAEQFVHAYFELIPDVTFLTAEVEILDNGLLVEIVVDQDAEISVEFRDRLTYQLNALGLNHRYAREINVYVGGQAPSFHGIYAAADTAGVQEYLTRQAVYEAGRFHTNDWRAVVFRGLASHDGFCDGGFSQVFPLA